MSASPLSRNSFLIGYLLPLLILPALWIAYPKLLPDEHGLGNSVMDYCDTQWYDRFDSHIGFRMAIVAVVKVIKFIIPGITPFQVGTILSSFALLGLFHLLRVYYRRFEQREMSQWILLAYIGMSPIIVLTAALITTDLYAGLVCGFVLLSVEKMRQDKKLERASTARIATWALLLMISWSIKETILFLWVAYGIVFLLLEWRRLDKLLPFILKLLAFCAALLGLEILIQKFLYDDPFHKYRQMLVKNHGGNGAGEVAGSGDDVPLHPALFHFWNHVKIYGRMGVAGLLSVGAAIYFRRNVFAQVFLSGMVVMTALAFTSRFLMERYWLIFILFEMVLVVKLMEDVRQRGKLFRWIWLACIAGAWLISLYNFFYRYNPDWVRSLM